MSFSAVVDIAEARLDPATAIDFVSDPGFGGIAVFVGRVRDLNHGRVVTGVSYDMFDPLALRGFEAIAERARAEFGPKLRLYIAHAKGRLAVGDPAVVVAAGTPHRDEAFRACRQAIE
ncbi:MAG TPA: molybdenum cofactor biosynthesis protein MoaE, partial [Xanthomonadaceae bacterium]|nr:molybdenum cofactor biosynthesis protein MoaE [Xanthomonadaceae bacterium]